MAARRMEESTYNRLEEKKHEIRLLILQPAPNPDDPIIIDSNVVSLLDKPVYDALSYCWGDPTNTQDITYGDQQIAVTVSLFGALRRLRYSDKPRTLWADAISINQSDTSERNAQVRLMGKIYTNATKVLIWLGEHNDYTDIAFHLLEDLAHGATIANLQRHEPIKYLTATSLLTIFTRPWFERLWVLQEVILAREADMICGDFTLPFDCIKVIAALHAEGSDLMGMEHTFNDRFNLDVQVGIRNYFQNYLQKLNGVEKHKDDLQTAVVMFGRCRNLRCKVPHDKIYGLLGLLRQEEAIEVDYDRPILDVYRDAALLYLRQAKSACILLDSCREDFSNPTADWPSWVPDWRIAPKSRSGTSAGWTDTLLYNATLDVMDLEPRVLSPSILAVKAVLCSNLEVVGETMDAYEDTEECKAQRASRELFGQDSCIPAASRVMQQLLSWQTTLQISEQNFWRIILRDRMGRSDDVSFSRNPKSGGWRRMTDEDNKPVIQAWHEIVANSQPTPSINEAALKKYANFFQGLEPYLVDARPFRTASGLPGQGPRNIQPNDCLAIIAGIPSPIVLRQVPSQGKNHFWNIGPCYAHGIMYGEAVAKLLDQQPGRCEAEDVYRNIFIV